MLAALPAALLAQGVPSGRWLAERRLGPPGVSPLAPLLPGALPGSPSRDERSHGGAALSQRPAGPEAPAAPPTSSVPEAAPPAAARRPASLDLRRPTHSRPCPGR